MAKRQRKNLSRRLLVLACSSRKVVSAGTIPAIDRYDGVAFRVIKRLQRLGQYPENVDLLIVSAKYGLIRHDYPIQHYDLLMTSELAAQQAALTRIMLGRIVERGSYEEVFVSAGKAYLLALEPFDAWKGTALITVNSGKIGVQLKSLKEWLLRGTS